MLPFDWKFQKKIFCPLQILSLQNRKEFRLILKDEYFPPMSTVVYNDNCKKQNLTEGINGSTDIAPISQKAFFAVLIICKNLHHLVKKSV